ncbi:GNAT family N-acetyltransferase [Herbaspirillum sp. alder98]|uniref:GNAT family N-acetyltransferase n=1 Tax=Herbaspirillum sp. alder98 TaxID=2913096 RepID=UPI001CD8B93E|nr:GNAT family protein [Herbaspirillum sp. alder98]MCA1324965.1 GNAT family N-acetyltransferase [Herbaspirillum sp. alder98]
MTAFISPQPTLSGQLLELQPLQPGHRQALLEAAADGQLWNMTLTVVPSAATIDKYLSIALDGRAAGNVWPFVIVLRGTGQVIGTTRFWKMDAGHRKLEIGHTWLAQSHQRSGANTEAKLLLLQHAFEQLGCVRVQFTTDELNTRSRAAILRIGATQEGIVRHERIMPDGRKRNSVRFSIIDDEWDAVKAALMEKLGQRISQI